MAGVRRPIAGKAAAIAVKIRGGSNQEAADAAGVSLRTLVRWKASPDWKKRYSATENEMIAAAAGAAVAMGHGALTTLDAIRQDVNAPAAARVSACRCILETVVRIRDHAILGTRLDRIEEALRAGRPGTALLPAPRDWQGAK